MNCRIEGLGFRVEMKEEKGGRANSGFAYSGIENADEESVLAFASPWDWMCLITSEISLISRLSLPSISVRISERAKFIANDLLRKCHTNLTPSPLSARPPPSQPTPPFHLLYCLRLLNLLLTQDWEREMLQRGWTPFVIKKNNGKFSIRILEVISQWYYFLIQDWYFFHENRGKKNS